MYFYILLLYIVITSPVYESLPIKGDVINGKSLMDQLHEQIKKSIDRKRDEISRLYAKEGNQRHSPKLFQPTVTKDSFIDSSKINDGFVALSDNHTKNNEASLDAPSSYSNQQNVDNVANISVKIPVFQASSYTKEARNSTTQDLKPENKVTDNTTSDSGIDIRTNNIESGKDAKGTLSANHISNSGNKAVTSALKLLTENKTTSDNITSQILEQGNDIRATKTSELNNHATNNMTEGDRLTDNFEKAQGVTTVPIISLTKTNGGSDIKEVSRKQDLNYAEPHSAATENLKNVSIETEKNKTLTETGKFPAVKTINTSLVRHNTSGQQVNASLPGKLDGTGNKIISPADERTKRHCCWEHNNDHMEMHNNPYHWGGDFMHGGAHDEFHNVDEHGDRFDLGDVTLNAPSHVEPHYHHYQPIHHQTDIHNEPQFHTQQFHEEPHYHHNYHYSEPHYENVEHHYHDNHEEHYHHDPHYLHNEIHIHHDHENFHDEPEEHYGSGGHDNYDNHRFHHVKFKVHGEGKTPDEWHRQEEQENQEMPRGETDELNNYDTGAGFFQLDEHGGDVEIDSMHHSGTKVHMGGGHFSVIRDPWRYHSAFAGMFHPHESIGAGGVGGGEGGIQQFHQHFTYINNNRNENHRVQNLVHHEHEPEHDKHEHHYEEHYDDHHQHHDHHHHGHGDGHDDDHHDDGHHHHHHEEDEDHHHYEEHRMDDHHLSEHPDGGGQGEIDQGFQRGMKLYPGADTKFQNPDPPSDNAAAPITPNTAVKRTSNHFREVSAITPKAARMSKDSTGSKRNDVELDSQMRNISLHNQENPDDARKAFFEKLKNENEASDDEVSENDSGSGDTSGTKKMAIKLQDHAESKEPNLLDIQQFHVNGPTNPEPWVVREFISPMVSKKHSIAKQNQNLYSQSLVPFSRMQMIRKSFFNAK